MRTVLILPLLLASAPLLAQQRVPVDVVLESDLDSVSYAVGLNLGMQALKDSIVLNPDAIAEGLRDASDMETARLSAQQIQPIMQKFSEWLMARQQAQMARDLATDSVDAVVNGAAGKRFLATNKTNPGVTTLPGGVQYKVIREGSGPKPTMEDSIAVAYTGKLVNGDIFEGSIELGGPVTFSFDEVIPGWVQTILMMKVGSKWEIYIPPSSGFGIARSGEIPPNSTLIYEVELLGIRR